MAPGSTAIRIGMVTTANRSTSSGIHIRTSLLMATSLLAEVDSAIGSAICHKETASSGWSTSWASDDLRCLFEGTKIRNGLILHARGSVSANTDPGTVE